MSTDLRGYRGWVVFFGGSDEPHYIPDDDELYRVSMDALRRGLEVEIFGVFE